MKLWPKSRIATRNFDQKSLARIELINGIIDEYGDQKLTARQVYYRLVAGGHVENTPRSYQNLTALLTDARYAGKVDWDIIEDRGRELKRANVSARWRMLVNGKLWDLQDKLIDAKRACEADFKRGPRGRDDD